jgi:2,3-bisphosphoglycerate-independent phosphoglycerate mutase
MDLEFIQSLIKKNQSKIVFVIIDGIGGIDEGNDHKTELEAAYSPNLDNLVRESICGLQIPVNIGITPGSGPGHLAVFGYDPLKYRVGRGILAAHGIGFNLKEGDVAARGNFCTITDDDTIIDRRAGRISSEKNKELCKLLKEQIRIPNVEVFIETVKEHRFLLVFRGEKLSGALKDTDPQEIGKKPLKPSALNSSAEYTAGIVQQFLDQAHELLIDKSPTNMVLLRGFSIKPCWPQFCDCFGLKGAAIATYPMYKGIAKLIGMDILETGKEMNEEFDSLEKNWNKYDFFYLHIKKADSYGEDGNFEKKKSIIEEVDKLIPRLRALGPDVIVITGDHSTPSKLKMHSWHPVPVLLWSENCRKDTVDQFGERSCIRGALGTQFPAEDLIVLALANAKRLEKFGA